MYIVILYVYVRISPGKGGLVVEKVKLGNGELREMKICFRLRGNENSSSLLLSHERGRGGEGGIK